MYLVKRVLENLDNDSFKPLTNLEMFTRKVYGKSLGQNSTSIS